MKIVGILNITTDSFSDGMRYLDTAAAIEKGLSLAAEGADLVDIGAESTSIYGQKITAAQEIERLSPVIEALRKEGVRISVDTYKPEVMEHVVALGVEMINDVSGLKDETAIRVVQRAGLPVVVMFNRNPDVRAQTTPRDHTTVMGEVVAFFSERLKTLHDAGIAGDRVIIDPGMGLFIGGTESSLMVLRHLETLKQFGRKIYLSPSRKSFIGAVLDRPVEARGYGTLAVEIWAYLHGVEYIRTHEPGPLRDAIRMIQAIEQVE
ncbi:dihydropteroate synthase [Dehalococcoidia bacterium]|nr:dihydropteroate synthase [Dehalococcoidia bacterium]MCL0087522.1 dihydropteroate synthase [Dehalococcoidia bacterium]